MRLFSYVVAHDFGFAPNPFFGFCTLACCKPEIRRTAKVGDWVAGIGPMGKGLGFQFVYAMEVAELLTFDEYWRDPRFFLKRPNFHAALKRAYGDNIYHRASITGEWVQEDSRHSLKEGKLNEKNLKRDTGATDKVLVATNFAYWGGEGPVVPDELQNLNGETLFIRTSAHRCKFSDEYVRHFVEWFHDQKDRGVCALPVDWRLDPS